MDKDRVAGSAKQAKGAVKQAVGKVIGDSKLQSEENVGLDDHSCWSYFCSAGFNSARASG